MFLLNLLIFAVLYLGMARVLNVAHQNIQSLKFKIPDVESFCTAFNIDVLVVSETHLRPDFQDSHISIPNYSVFRNDRVNRGGGGVLIYCKSDLRPREVQCNCDLEMIVVDITCAAKFFRVIGIYLPIFTNQEKLQAIDKLESFLVNDLGERGNCVILGDFNLDLLDSCDIHSHFVSVMNDLHFEQLITQPTHDNRTLIDHIWISNALKSEATASLAAPIAQKNHHDCLFLRLQVPGFFRQPPQKICVWDYGNADFESLEKDIISELGIAALADISLDNVVQQWAEKLSTLV